ncbi:glycosyltransferase [bacterium]|nr:MAG: glycosyltransferase [bacterium]
MKTKATTPLDFSLINNEGVEEFLKKDTPHFHGSVVLIFIPVRNEEQSIATVINKVRRSTNFDILVIDDQSTDSTSQILKNLNVEVLTRRSNVGSRIINGLTIGYFLGYDYIVKIDGDDQHNPEDIKRLYERAQNTNADIVIGSRHLEHFNANILSINGAGMWFCAQLASCFYGKRITDATSGLKIWSRRACEIAIQSFREGKLKQGSTYHVEELLIASRKKLNVEEIGVVMRPREYGESKSFAIKDLFTFPFNLIRSVLRALL